MISSMTGYAVVSRDLPQGALNLELRSVNHRYLDIQFRLPDELRGLEPAMREAITPRLARGKVDCRVSYALLSQNPTLGELNRTLLENLAALSRAVQEVLPESQSLRVVDVLRWPGMLGSEPLSAESLHSLCLELLQAGIDELVAARQREGEKLKALLLERIARMRELTSEVAPRIPTALAAFQEKLASRLREALLAHDDERIRQEIALFANKIDVDEELTRLSTHLEEVTRVLEQGGVVGKRLDFLMQELNREANTLGAKAADAEVSRVAMELKVLIEQMREQIQNIE